MQFRNSQYKYYKEQYGNNNKNLLVFALLFFVIIHSNTNFLYLENNLSDNDFTVNCRYWNNISVDFSQFIAYRVITMICCIKKVTYFFTFG